MTLHLQNDLRFRFLASGLLSTNAYHTHGSPLLEMSMLRPVPDAVTIRLLVHCH